MENWWAVAIVLALGFVFPIGAAIYAFRKNRPGWGIATLVTTPLGFGWLVGVVAVLIKPQPKKGLLPVACPQCGGVQGNYEAYKASTESGERVGSPILAGLGLLLGVGLAFAGGWMAVELWRNPLPSSASSSSPCMAVGFLVMIGGSLASWGANGLRRWRGGTEEVMDLTCDACGTAWKEKAADLPVAAPVGVPVGAPVEAPVGGGIELAATGATLGEAKPERPWLKWLVIGGVIVAVLALIGIPMAITLSRGGQAAATGTPAVAVEAPEKVAGETVVVVVTAQPIEATPGPVTVVVVQPSTGEEAEPTNTTEPPPPPRPAHPYTCPAADSHGDRDTHVRHRCRAQERQV